MPYFSAMLLLKNLNKRWSAPKFDLSCCSKKVFAHRPPRKCLPLNHLTNGFGAVRLMRAVGWKSRPGPESGGPDSMFQEDGASTARTGIEVVLRDLIMPGNGSRISPEKEKPRRDISQHSKLHCDADAPKMESTTKSVSDNEV